MKSKCPSKSTAGASLTRSNGDDASKRSMWKKVNEQSPNFPPQRDAAALERVKKRKVVRSDHSGSLESTKPRKKQRHTSSTNGDPKSSTKVVLHKFRRLRSSGKPVKIIMNATNTATSRNEFTHEIEFGESNDLDKVMDWYKNDVFPNTKYWITEITHSGKHLEPSTTAGKLKLKNGDIIDVKVSSSLKICVRDETGEKTEVNISKNENLKSIFNSYAEQKGVETKRLRFYLRGKLLQGSESSSSLGLERNDDIYRMMGHIQKEDELTICILDQAGEHTEFQIKRSTCLSQIFYSYAAKKRLDMDKIRFYSKGEVVFGHNTPQTAEIKSGDEIICVVEQPRIKRDTLTLSIIDQAGEEVFLIVRTHTKFEKIFSKYRQIKKNGALAHGLSFFFNGDVIDEDSTPNTLGLEDHDNIFAQSKDASMVISIKDEVGEIMIFKVKETTRCGKKFSSYASKKGLQVDSLRFLLHGEEIHKDATPLSLGLEDEDEIYVQSKAMTITVRDETGEWTYFKIRDTTSLGKVFSTYAKRKGAETDDFYFHQGGRVFDGRASALSAGLENADEIRASLRVPITIVVKDERGTMTFFNISKGTSLAILFSAYARREGVSADSLYFHQGGEVIEGYDTALSLGLGDGDVILADKHVPVMIILLDNGCERTFFKVKKTTSFAKILGEHARRKGVDVTFLECWNSEGETIHGHDTPLSLGLEDKDVITVYTNNFLH